LKNENKSLVNNVQNLENRISELEKKIWNYTDK
jgi:hypothetical protein